MGGKSCDVYCFDMALSVGDISDNEMCIRDSTPREMKDQIIKLLDDWKGQQKEVAKPEKDVYKRQL